MIEEKQVFTDMINSPVRHIKARVELYNGSTLIDTFAHNGALKSFTVERIGEGKFFGFGICQRLNVKLRDVNREINITTANALKVQFGAEDEYLDAFPVFYVSEVHRDEITNELSITAYDALYDASAHTVSELYLDVPYSISGFAAACGVLLGVPVVAEYEAFNTVYPTGANFEGTENIREALNAVAEATQTIYYLNANNTLIFKRLDIAGEPVLTIDKSKYLTLDSGDNKRLAVICSATELGDNVSASTTAIGSTQYVRDNPFWELREDIADIVDAALAAIGGLTINQFNCDWRGNFLVEIGDKLAITTKDNELVYSYLLNDTVSYDGTYSQATDWEYTIDDNESFSNSTSIGEVIKQTYAKVDKVNKQIDIVVSSVEGYDEQISNIQVATDSITNTIANIETNTTNSLNDMADTVAVMEQRVATALTKEDFKIELSTELKNGVDSVKTATGYVFNEDGLTVSKADKEMTTTITEDGMTVFKDGEAMLTANNIGVNAANLNASTYLIIGDKSRFENYGSNRTGCFWIGG
jgi:hypothetical protein